MGPEASNHNDGITHCDSLYEQCFTLLGSNFVWRSNVPFIEVHEPFHTMENGTFPK